MGYTGIGERTALLKSSGQLHVNSAGDLRQAHKWIMETSRFQNRLDSFIAQAQPDVAMRDISHGVRSLLRIIAYMKLIDSRPRVDLERAAGWGRQIIGWRTLLPYEKLIARLISSTPNLCVKHLLEFDRISLETCHPTWYAQRLMAVFGRSFALKLLRRDLLPVSTFVRINSLKADEKRILGEELHARQADNVEGVYILDADGRGDERAKLASLGRIVIQDLASIVAGLVASPQPKQVVLDFCAAPGNKTSHLAAQMNNEGEIFSVELSRSRSIQWRKEMVRTGCTIANLILADARRTPLHIQADVVLVDPPCSNSGVFARNPASKWRITPRRLKDLLQGQSEILQTASDRVNGGGTLVYCTCSILPEENEFIVEAFLKKKPEFALCPQTPFIGSPGLRGLPDCQRFYPCLHDCNGSFIAKMQRN
jgi:16S rRNA (cytosine967-C5)-methyltransferase